MGLCLAGSRINATALIRGMFHQASNKPQPGSGVLPVAWLEEARFLPAAVRKISASRALHDGSLSYGEPMGDAGLRADGDTWLRIVLTLLVLMSLPPYGTAWKFHAPAHARPLHGCNSE